MAPQMRSSSKQASALPHLPQEIITEILLRLPARSLWRFRCVSKSWLSLICNSKFIRTHLQNSSTKRKLIFQSSDKTAFRALSLDYLDSNPSVEILPFDCSLYNPNHEYMCIVGSCNGLVCLGSYELGIILWNPITGKSRKLPKSGYGNGLYNCSYGFGYDAVNDDYKVIEIQNGHHRLNDPRFSIYSLRGNSWRIAEWPGGRIYGRNTFIHGALHWQQMLDNAPLNGVIFAINMMNEKYTLIPRPNPDHSQVIFDLHEAGDHLCMFYIYLTHMDVWVLQEYGVKESWTKLVRMPRLQDLKYKPSLVFVSKDGPEILLVASSLVTYKESRFQEIRLLGDKVGGCKIYTESLVFPYFEDVMENL